MKKKLPKELHIIANEIANIIEKDKMNKPYYTISQILESKFGKLDLEDCLGNFYEIEDQILAEYFIIPFNEEFENTIKRIMNIFITKKSYERACKIIMFINKQIK